MIRYELEHLILEMAFTGIAEAYKVDWRDIAGYKHDQNNLNMHLYYAKKCLFLILSNFFSYDDIGIFLNLSYDTVKQNIYMAQHLKKSEPSITETVTLVRNKIDTQLLTTKAA